MKEFKSMFLCGFRTNDPNSVMMAMDVYVRFVLRVGIRVKRLDQRVVARLSSSVCVFELVPFGMVDLSLLELPE